MGHWTPDRVQGLHSGDNIDQYSFAYQSNNTRGMGRELESGIDDKIGSDMILLKGRCGSIGLHLLVFLK